MLEEVQYDIKSVFDFLLDNDEVEAAQALVDAFKRILGPPVGEQSKPCLRLIQEPAALN